MLSLLRLPPAVRLLLVPRYFGQVETAAIEVGHRGKNAIATQHCRYATHQRQLRFEIVALPDNALTPEDINEPSSDAVHLARTDPAEVVGDAQSDHTKQHLSDMRVHHGDKPHIATIDHIHRNMNLPKPDDYPEWFAKFNPIGETCTFIHSVCSKHRLALMASHEYDYSEAHTKDGAAFKCMLSVKIGRIVSTEVEGYGTGKKLAARAAWLLLLSELHTSGVLDQLLPPPMPNPFDAPSSAEALAELKTMIPWVDYRLFRTKTMVSAFKDACNKAGLSMKSEGEVSNIENGGQRYELRLQVDGLVEGKAEASHRHGTEAKYLAWIYMFKEMQSTGALQKLFIYDDHEPSKTVSSTPQILEQENPAEEVEEMELVTLDAFTMKAEKDAKLEIFNWAARYGLIPEFHAGTQPPKTRRARVAKKSERQKIVQASISLTPLGISVTSAAKDLETAETGAAIEFKRRAEEVQSQPGAVAIEPPPGFELLTIETGRQFATFCGRYRTYLEMEIEVVPVAGVSHHAVRTVIDGDTLPTRAVMRTKKDATAVAYLQASIHIAKSHPERLKDYAAAESGPRVNRALTAPLGGQIVNMMRDGLIDARRAGLPDVREPLKAEDFRPDDSSTSPRWRHLGDMTRQIASAQLQESRRQFELDSSLDELRTSRASLPMSKQSSQVTNTISGQTYSIIVGATGSGKTTQVPQILLDDAIKRGEGGFCDIICTQPRRLAATSIAQRVAVERNEPLGDTVGYQVRFDARLPRRGGSITYCTTGILLAQLKHDPDGVLDNVSHLVVDEVHERDLNIDFLLVILKKAIEAREAAGKKTPKVVLMSATLDTKLFADYLARKANGQNGVCPSLSVPGRTFPVKERYLKEIVEEMKSVNEERFMALMERDNNTSLEFLAAEESFARGRAAGPRDIVIDWKRGSKGASEDAVHGSELEEGMVPLALLCATIAHICKASQDDGAILAFLPGVREITMTESLLRQQPIFGVDFNDVNRHEIHSLHSQVAPDQQSEVLKPPATGCRKIILSTNIAETSLTVPDVQHVIDTGKLRELRYDQVRRITRLQTVWESRSNARQRAGRAGRVQKGNYYALYTRERRDAMPVAGKAELLRSDLQGICLSIKSQGFGESISQFLLEAIEPPTQKAVDAAVENLKAIEAITAEEKLTALGRVLSTLPVDPRLGKMILLGVISKCLHPVLVLGSMDSAPPFFRSPPGARKEAKAAQKHLNQHESDQLAYLEAFNMLKRASDGSGFRHVSEIANSNYLNIGAFRTVASTAEQIRQLLVEAGLIPDEAGPQYGGPRLNVNAGNPMLIKCLLLAGTYPNIGVKNPGKTSSHRTVDKSAVLLHPGSVNYSRRSELPDKSEDRIYAFSALARSVDGVNLFMRDSTLVTPLMVILFGGTLSRQGRNVLKMDEWLPFHVQTWHDAEYAVKLALEYRKGLDRVLNHAFNSLSNSDGRFLVDNELLDQFTSNVAELVRLQEPDAIQTDQSWTPDRWSMGRSSHA
jgi:HrpA-like RNA helicase